MKKMSKSLKYMSPVKLIVFSFLLIIILGTFILILPISSRSGQKVNFVDALFVATSTTCVTGLTPFDTYTQWSGFGQFIIMLLIQIGGLGIISFTTGFTMFLHKKLGLRDMQIAKEYTSGNVINVPRLIRTIIYWSLSCEIIGAIILAVRFIPLFGLFRGTWFSVFTAVSAYCNAGFDLMGFVNPGSSFIDYAGDPIISLAISILVILGGIGFIVVSDIFSCIIKKIHDIKSHPRLTLHSFVVIIMSLFLLIIGTILFMFFEYNNTLTNYNFFEKLNISFFQSSVARTAGFFSVPVGFEKTLTKLTIIVLMFIGASSASTGGGIKTTTLVVILATINSVIRGYDDTILLKHRVEKSTVYKAFALTCIGFFLVSIFTVLIAVIESSKDITVLDITVETVSAFATVGLTAGITNLLSDISKIFIILMMFIGRVGPISFMFAVSVSKNKDSNKIMPPSKIIVG